jgi:hypothetical protein
MTMSLLPASPMHAALSGRANGAPGLRDGAEIVSARS